MFGLEFTILTEPSVRDEQVLHSQREVNTLLLKREVLFVYLRDRVIIWSTLEFV